MAGAAKNRSRREAERPHGPPSSSAQSSSGQSTTSSAHESVKTISTAAKTVMSAQYDGLKDTTSGPMTSSMIGMRNLEALGMSVWRGHLDVSENYHNHIGSFLHLHHLMRLPIGIRTIHVPHGRVPMGFCNLLLTYTASTHDSTVAHLYIRCSDALSSLCMSYLLPTSHTSQ